MPFYVRGDVIDVPPFDLIREVHFSNDIASASNNFKH